MTPTVVRRTLSIAVITAMAGVPLGALELPAATAAPATFNYTGAEQTYVVPSGVTVVHVTAVGGEGGFSDGGAGGFGGVATADVVVTPGHKLYVEVGSNGGGLTGTSTAGGWNGGGSTVDTAGANGSGGGGASDVRTETSINDSATTLSSRLVVAGGGGGGGGGTGTAGTGTAGGNADSNGTPRATCGAVNENACGGVKGTTTAGGAGGAASAVVGLSGGDGTLGQGGGSPLGIGGAGGGGGGGVYGGGGGGSSGDGQFYTGGSGGGGASGFGAGTANTSISVDATGVPSVTITPYPPAKAPQTTIKSSTIKKTHGKATFSFSSSVKSSTFACALAKGKAKPSYKTCKSPKTYKRLKPGGYTFKVKAIVNGTQDPSPASKTFSIKKKKRK